LLLTDYWTSPRGGATRLAPGREAAKAAQRFHPDLIDAKVEHVGTRRLVFELWARLTRRNGWETVLRRNALFQRVMLERIRSDHESLLSESPGVFFAYSYAALGLLRKFKEAGWKTVLGQIDPGVREEDIVAAELARRPDLPSRWKRAPDHYWRAWREECDTCDRIMVNSEWSREALAHVGIAAGKIDVVPLAFETPTTNTPHAYPTRFDHARPLRVLFLGQLTIRKGVHLAIEAARTMRSLPVHWTFVGPGDVDLPADLLSAPFIRWSGAVSREETARLYRESDVFLLPTLSDGFALTQLEARACGLPVLASRFCGDVVRAGENGLIIDPLDASGIVRATTELVRSPERVAAMSRIGPADGRFSLEALEARLVEIEERLSRP
jgi:glycosyltransferase involved in cell wall biosynthesis